MMFGINGGELVVILVIAVIVVGPERLPQYAEQLGVLVRRLRGLLTDAREKVSEELGPEIADIDWAQLDPRRYDPRRIVRDALLDDTIFDSRTQSVMAGAAVSSAAPNAPVTPTSRPRWPTPTAALPTGVPAPFDPEAT